MPPLGAEWKDWAALAADIATVVGGVAIPIVIWLASKRQEKLRQTFALLHDIGCNAEVMSRKQRLFQYRLWREAKPQARRNLTNPYANGNDFSWRYDAAMILNFYDQASIMILHGAVDEQMLYQAGRELLIGARDIIAKEFVDQTGMNISGSFPSLDLLADKWHYQSKVERHQLNLRIPVRVPH